MKTPFLKTVIAFALLLTIFVNATTLSAKNNLFAYQENKSIKPRSRANPFAWQLEIKKTNRIYNNKHIKK